MSEIHKRQKSFMLKLRELLQHCPSILTSTRLGRVLNTGEIIVHPNYLAIYRLTDRIEILSVLHARQQYP